MFFDEGGDEHFEDQEYAPYDERAQLEGDYGGGAAKKNNNIPFSFLMHHYLKTNGGQQQVKNDPQVGVRLLI